MAVQGGMIPIPHQQQDFPQHPRHHHYHASDVAARTNGYSRTKSHAPSSCPSHTTSFGNHSRSYHSSHTIFQSNGSAVMPSSARGAEPLLPLLARTGSRLNPGGGTGGRASSGGGDGEEMYVLGIGLHKMSPPVRIAVCMAGVLGFYLLYGYSQEWIFRVPGFRQFGWYLTLLQFFFYSLFGVVERTIQRQSGRNIPLSTYVVIAFMTVATMGLSNTSLGYLNYPTQVIFKSCKLVPVMVGGILIQGKRYKVLNGVAVVLMSAGLVLFNLADLSVLPNMNKTGILLISLALCADAVIGNLQEKAMKQYSGSNLEMILYSYSIGMVYIFIWVTASGSLLPALLFCMKNPELYLMIAVFSLTGYLGINFVLALVRTNGALVAVTVTTFRKTLTVVLSFLVFTKPFTMQYLWAGLLVLIGILLNVYCKNTTIIDGHLNLARIRLMRFLPTRGRSYTSRELSV